MAQWTAATTLQRFAEILKQETGKDVLGDDSVLELDGEDAIQIFKDRIVKDAMHPEARHKDKTPKKSPTATEGVS